MNQDLQDHVETQELFTGYGELCQKMMELLPILLNDVLTSTYGKSGTTKDNLVYTFSS